jgi:quercetin dioxygenase-like cupin family protein
MPNLLNPKTLANAVPFKPLQVLGGNEGRIVRPLGLAFRWKVTGADTGYAFAVYEMELEPGSAIPVHVHPFAEFFYVLEGRVEALGLDDDGQASSRPLSSGECANVPANTPHGLRNASDRPARFLSVASFEHEEAFNRIERGMVEAGGEALPGSRQAEIFMQLASEMQIHFLAA